MMTLRQLGIRREQVTLHDMAPAAQLTALKNKEIDAAMVWEPWLHRMVSEVNTKVIAKEGDLGIYTMMDGYSVRRSWLRDNREIAVRFLRAILMAYDIVQKDPMVAVRAYVQEVGITEAWAKEMYQDVPPPNIYWWADHGYRYSLVEDAGFHRRLRYLAAFLLDEKVIDREADVNNALDASVITEALKMRK
jgi:ABC-type nitrate/sulfonate/bicarbonate transport system substrate-binding protein